MNRRLVFLFLAGVMLLIVGRDCAEERRRLVPSWGGFPRTTKLAWPKEPEPKPAPPPPPKKKRWTPL